MPTAGAFAVDVLRCRCCKTADIVIAGVATLHRRPHPNIQGSAEYSLLGFSF